MSNLGDELVSLAEAAEIVGVSLDELRQLHGERLMRMLVVTERPGAHFRLADIVRIGGGVALSQNGQSYSRRDVARLLKVKEAELMQGERGAIVEHIERRHGKLCREVCDRWIRMGAPTPSSMAGATGRMDYTPLAGTRYARGVEA